MHDEAIDAMDREEVLDAIMQLSSTKLSISAKTFCFISRFSMMASITSLLPLIFSKEFEKLILPRIASFSDLEILSFSTKRLSIFLSLFSAVSITPSKES